MTFMQAFMQGFVPWWGTTALLGCLGLYILGRQPKTNETLLWGAFLCGIALGWFMRGPFVVTVH